MSYVAKNLDNLARGDDWALKFTITDSTNTPIDITGNTYWMTLKENRDDPDPGVAQANVVAIAPDSINGIVFITFDSANTYSIEPGNYFYDLQEVDLIGNVYTLLLGRVKIVKDITRNTTL